MPCQRKVVPLQKIAEVGYTWHLVVKGIRQCGKTTAVKHFAQTHYENTVYIDFHEQDDMISLFDGSLNVDNLTTIISAALPTARFVPYKTCLILDEIQECPNARTAIKFLVEEKD